MGEIIAIAIIVCILCAIPASGSGKTNASSKSHAPRKKPNGLPWMGGKQRRKRH